MDYHPILKVLGSPYSWWPLGAYILIVALIVKKMKISIDIYQKLIEYT